MKSEIQSNAFPTLAEMEKDYIRRVLEDRRWRIDGPEGAARVLGLNPNTLRSRLKSLGLYRPTVQIAHQ